MTFSGQVFVVTDFEQREPPLIKHAQVFTTVRANKFLIFAFTANSAGNVQPIADSMKTLEFTGRSASFLGFDRNDYPGDENLSALHKTFEYSGYWLNNPPGARTNSWVGKRGKLEAAGFGFLVLFNGRLYAELKTVAHATSIGQSDGQLAVTATRREGFLPGTIIFLDQEQGGRMLPEQKAYILAWVDEVSRAGFRAGIYCSGMAAKEDNGSPIVTAENIRQNADGRKITFWVTQDGCPPAPGCTIPQHPPSPAASGIAFADVWQFAQSPKRKDVAAACPGYNSDGNCYPPSASANQRLPVDLDIATSDDPSHGRRR
jgi:hypothetical protein